MNARRVAPPARLSAIVLLFIATLGNTAQGQSYGDFITPTPLPEHHTLIIGFLGGLQNWNSQKRSVRKLALRLREMNGAGLHVETIENRKRKQALALIRNAFDRNRDGRLDAQECAAARLILYGHSFGGAAVVKLARQLQKLSIPVLLTVQVDSVGRDDEVIPANVRAAANLFQRDGLIVKGEKTIRAEDPGKTTILGNFQFTYREKQINISKGSWFEKTFGVAHTKMEFDPDVWAKVEELIVTVLTSKK